MLARLVYVLMLVALTFAGRWFVDAFSIPLPAPLLGMLVLLTLLFAIQGVPEGLLWCSRLLLRYLSLFFIPVTVAVITFKSQLIAHWQIISLTLLSTTIFSLILTALITNHLLVKKS